jgi:hypothetical protein
MKFSTLFFTLAAFATFGALFDAPTLLAAAYCQVCGFICMAAKD